MGRPSRADVRATYERIGDHFSKTREYAWPEVESFIAEHAEGGLALDAGCGNGRHTELLADAVDRAIGLDASRKLLAAASDRLDGVRRVDLLQGDAATLPLRADTVDVGVYVATLHHLPTAATRRESLDELARVLAPEARALVSAWSTAHDRFDATAAEEWFDTTVDWTLPGDKVVPRYYHIYSPAEFERTVAASDLVLESLEISSGNCYAVVRPEGKRP